MKQALLLILLFTTACATSNDPGLAITNVTVIDATGAAARPSTTVLVRDGRIAAVGPAARVSVPKNVRVVDGRGKYLIPGLFDMHTHLSFFGEEALATLVRYGVLAVRDLGGSLEELDRWRAEIGAGTRIGPRIFRAGPFVDGVREYDESDAGKLRKATTIMVANAEEARAAVRSLKQRGVDTVKTHRSLSREAFLAVAGECRRQDLPLATHLASPTVRMEEASDAGVTTLEHCEMLTESITFADVPPGGKPTKDPVTALDELTDERATELFRRFVRNGTAYDPALVAYRTFMQEAVDIAPKDPRWQKAAAGRSKMFHRFVQLTGLMRRVGVQVVAGTDFGARPETVPYPVSMPGVDLHEELRLFVEGGFTPMEALQAATIVPARILRASHLLGTIERGREANLVLLDADPLADIANTRRIAAVVLRGRVLEDAEPTLPVPGTLAVDGTPEVPAELARNVSAYTTARSTDLQAWHPARREMLVTTRSGDTLQVHRVDAPGGAPAQLTFFDDNVDRGIAYEPDGGSILFTKDSGGDGNDQIYRLALANRETTRITDGRSRNGNGVRANHGPRIVYTSTRRNGRDTDLYVTDRLLAQVEGSGWMPLAWSPDDTRILAQQNISAGDRRLWLVDADSGAMTAVPCSGSCVFGAFTSDGKRIVTTTDADSEFRELVSIDLQSGDAVRLTKHIPWDAIELDLSSGGHAAIVTNEAGVFRLHIIDVASGAELPLPALPPGYVTGVHWHRNGRELGFNLDSAHAPTDVYSLDIPTGRVERWTRSAAGGADLSTFAEPRLIEWPSFDERKISGFLYLPPPSFTGKRPVLISIHGGPEDQFTPYFLGRWNYVLNELGVALLFPNVRGSSGFGKTFLKLDDGARREDALRDIGALLDWIQTQPQLDSARIAVTGTSYGGYLALSAAVRYDARIRATIDVVGPSNLVSFLEHTAAWRQDLRRVEYGDERDPATHSFLESIAPLRNASHITHPLFVVQGQNDPAVPVSEAEQIVRAVREHGTPVWYLLGRDEGHGFVKRRNAEYQFYLTVLFLRRFLL